MKVVHYMSAKYGLMALKNQRLKVSLYSDLNDPFELFSKSTKDRETRDLLRHIKHSYDKNYGLLCFSKTWHNPVMWGHYGDRYNGVALELDVPEKFLIKMIYRSSRYSNLYKKSDLMKFSDNEKSKLIERLTTTKFLHWEYEQEMRMHIKKSEAVLEKDLHFYSFNDSLRLSKIFLGPLSEISDCDIAKALPKGNEVQVVNTRLSFLSFRVVLQQQKRERTLIGVV